MQRRRRFSLLEHVTRTDEAWLKVIDRRRPARGAAEIATGSPREGVAPWLVSDIPTRRE